MNFILLIFSGHLLTPRTIEPNIQLKVASPQTFFESSVKETRTFLVPSTEPDEVMFYSRVLLNRSRSLLIFWLNIFFSLSYAVFAFSQDTQTLQSPSHKGMPHGSIPGPLPFIISSAKPWKKHLSVYVHVDDLFQTCSPNCITKFSIHPSPWFMVQDRAFQNYPLILFNIFFWSTQKNEHGIQLIELS